jgi:hypothetical protein
VSSPEEVKPAAIGLDAEREALRKAGYTEAEISQILIARASQQPAGAAGQGVMSNVLSSIVAVASHARVLIPTFRKDMETVFNSTATVSVRAGATVSLTVKAIVVFVLGFAAWQEWKQHIIYSTEIAEQQARKLSADAAAAEAQRRSMSAKPVHIPTEAEYAFSQCLRAVGRGAVNASTCGPSLTETCLQAAILNHGALPNSPECEEPLSAARQSPARPSSN